jgi:hypothetical protein
LREYLKKRFGTLFQWTIGITIVLLLLLLVLIQSPLRAKLCKGESCTYIQDKIKTKVVVAKLILFPKKNSIRGSSTLKVLKKDTLLCANNQALTSACSKLFNNKIEINSTDLEGVTSNITRGFSSVFNFDYIKEKHLLSHNQDPDTTPDDILTRKHQSGHDKPEIH